MAESIDRDRFDEQLASRNLVGLWKEMGEEDHYDSIEACLWAWDDVYDALDRSREVIDLDEEPQGVRRSVCLRNPIFDRGNWASKTMTAGIQSVKPGEVAKAHRHNIPAFRFVLEGHQGAYTTVSGERMPMRRGDLVLTPQYTWHDHQNEGEDPVVWLDGLPAPLWKFLDVPDFENYADADQDIDRSDGYSEFRWGKLRPTNAEKSVPSTPPYRYEWDKAYESLRTFEDSEEDYDPHDGYSLEYVDPETGGSTLTALSLRLQKLPPGVELDAHRHSSTELFHVFRGSGHTTVGEETYEWERGDSLVVPPNESHHHEAADEETILFTISDQPVLEMLNSHRIETS